MELSLAQVERAAAGRITGQAPGAEHPAELRLRGWSIDSRTTAPEDLFFAIGGEHFNGHAFVAAAFERGAAAAVVSEPVPGIARPLVEVSDTVIALQEVAQFAASEWGRPIVAVTGSAGKTSTKDIIACFLATRFQTGKAEGNLNNHIGLPLSLLRIPDTAELGVLEMGMNHAGEIRHLAEIAKPRIGVVTNVGYAHADAFDSIDGIAAAKRELIEALPENGTAVLNADDLRVTAFRDVHAGTTITYGFSPHADVRATDVALTSEGAAFAVDGTRFQTSLTGRHAISNILAGLAVARVFGIKLGDLTAEVSNLSPGKMRGERTRSRGITVLNDSYNSNPEAARSMIDVLREEPAERRIAVLGEMLELGRLAEGLHRELGMYVARAGIDVLVGVRGASWSMVDEAKKAGLSDRAAFFFQEPEAAGEFLRSFVRPGDAVLFKGSRGTHVERALATMET